MNVEAHDIHYGTGSPLKRKPSSVSSPAEFPPGTRDIRVEMGMKFTQADDPDKEERFTLPKPLPRRLSAEDAVKAIEDAEQFALPKPLPRRPSATTDKHPGLPMPKPAIGALKARLEAEGEATARVTTPVEELKQLNLDVRPKEAPKARRDEGVEGHLYTGDGDWYGQAFYVGKPPGGAYDLVPRAGGKSYAAFVMCPPKER